MPIFDWEKLHPSTQLRKPKPDLYAYHMVGDQSASNFEIPPLLESPLLALLPFFPKSALQYLNPLLYQEEHINENATQAVRFGVIFSQNFAVWADGILSEASPLHVFLWHTLNASAIDRLVRVDQPKLILVPHGKIADALRKAGVSDADMPQDIVSIHRRLTECARDGMGISPVVFEERLQRVAEIAKKYHENNFPRRAIPFTPLWNNLAQLAQLFGQFDEKLWKKLPNNRDKRATALAVSFEGVSAALHFVRSVTNHKAKRFRLLPAAILAFPSINPMMQKQWRHAVKKLPKKMRHLGKIIVAARGAEQDTVTYTNALDIDEIRSKGDLEIVVHFGVRQLASYTHFFDTAGYLHTSFGASPYLRAPIKGGSLAKQHKYFSPAQYARNPSSIEVCERVHEFGATLANAVDPSLRKALQDYQGGIVGMSDLPLEWMDMDGMPLGFAQDVCRMPEGAATNLLSQFSRNQHSTFRVTSKILKRTLVVCGAPDGDCIAESFIRLQAFHAEQPEPRPHLVRCLSLKEFYHVVNEFRPELLIIDSHGRFVHNNAGTEITFGDEHLDGVKVIKHLPQIPLVFLSACWGAPLYGCPNTIAHAFFEAGSFAVTASLLPVDVIRGGILYTRILRNLAMASSKPLHANWSSFVSHTVRTSYLSDLDALVRHRLGIKPNKGGWGKKRGKWFQSTMSFSTRRAAYFEAHDIVASCYEKELIPVVREILATREYLPEFMFYSTMGRADLVQFDAWNQRFHSPANDTTTVSEMNAKMTRRKSKIAVGRDC